MKVPKNLQKQQASNQQQAKQQKSEQLKIKEEDQKPKKLSRNNLFIFIVGHNRTGKTSVAINYAINYKKNNPDNKIIVFDPQNKFSEVRNIRIMPSDENWLVDLIKTKNALIILDDYRMLHQSNQSDPLLSDLMCLRAENNLDIIFICHNPKKILESLTYYANFFYIFYNKSKDKDWEDRLPDSELCISGSDFINNYVRKNGRGEYPKFPHVIVDTDNEKIITQNIDRKKI